MTKINRRDSLRSLAILAGGALTISTSAAYLSGCKADTSSGWIPSSISSDNIRLLELITERILPKTDSPGANDALVHRYIDQAYTNNFSNEDKEKFDKGISYIESLAREKYKQSFNELSSDQIDDILTILATEWKDNSEQNVIFKELRDLTLTGYASSEVGAKNFFIYDPIPGPYLGCIDYSEVGGTYSL